MDWTHLAHALRAARRDAGLTQPELATRAGVSLRTVKSLENPDLTYATWPRSLDAVVEALGKPEGWAKRVARGEEDVPDADPPPPEPLPLSVRMALEEGQLLDYDVLTFDVDGEPVTMIALARTGVYDDPARRDVLRRQLERFGRIKGHIRREAESSDGASGATQDD